MEVNNQVYRWDRSLLIRAGSHLPEPFGADDAGHRGADRFSGETVDWIPVTYLLVAIVLLLAPLILLPPVIDAVNFLINLDYEALTINSVQWTQDTLSALKSSGIHFIGGQYRT
jgi:hypothetical protein